ncbi:ACT domain containing protein [Candidatus Nanopelagicaceae bacterium]
MTLNTDNNEQFTGLILLTGLDKPGIASALFETLSPFAITILDIEQLIISDRLILTVLIGLNPSHQKAIETDLEECATSNEVDIATLFAARTITLANSDLVDVVVTSEKLHPKTIFEITSLVQSLDANIESVVRLASNPLTLCFSLSGTTMNLCSNVFTSTSFEDGSKLSIKAHG